MTTDSTDSTHFIAESERPLSPPRFDENAAANAQPVQPIPVSRVAFMRPQLASVWSAITRSSRILAAVVIAGLIIGTLGALWLVNDRQETVDSAADQEAMSTLPATLFDEPSAAIIGGTDLGNAPLTLNNVRKPRKRARSGRAPRAYRVAVLH